MRIRSKTMQSALMQDPDWNGLLGMDRLDPDAHLSPLSDHYSETSPPPDVPRLAAPQRSTLARTRNRNPRSCDFCRVRKTACILENDPPCTMCRGKGLECTFTQRRRGRRSHQGRELHQQQQQRDHFVPPRHDVTPFHFGELSSVTMSTPMAMAVMPMPTGLRMPTPTALAMPWQTAAGVLPAPHVERHSIGALFGDNDGVESQRFAQQPRRSPEGDPDTATLEQPLDQPSSTFLLLGDSAEGDPQLLKRSSHTSHADNLKFRCLYRNPHTTNGGEDLDIYRPLVFMLGSSSIWANCEPRVEEVELRKVRAEVDGISSRVGIRLVKLYFKYVYPYFPIVSRSRMLQDYGLAEDTVSDLPLSLKSALYACAMPYMVYDDVLSTMIDLNVPAAKTLFRICWMAISQEAHSPHLATMQACLMLLQRDNYDRYIHGSPFQGSLMAWTVSIAQTLGFSTDCSTVRGIPPWEKRLRKRLWWATYVLDKWTFSLSGLTSHIRDDDFDVLPLMSADFDADSRGSIALSPDPSPGLNHFQHLVDLTFVLSDTMDAFFTIRACKATANDFAKTSRLANDLDARLHKWKASFEQFTAAQTPNPAQRTRLDGNSSLHLAYWAVRLTVFRAMLRALTSTHGTVEDKQLRREYRDSVRKSAESYCIEVVDFVENLTPGAWNSFWHKFSPSNFAIASSTMMRLLITSVSPDETTRLSELIERWRWVLRSGGGNVGGVLVSLGLLRLDRTLLNNREREPSVTN